MTPLWRTMLLPVAALLAFATAHPLDSRAAAADRVAPAPGTQRLAQTTQVPNTSTRRPPGSISLPPKPRGIICIGGSVAAGRCVCRSGSATSTAPGIYLCRKPPEKPDASSGGSATPCSGGRVVSGRCLCPSGTVWRSGVCHKVGTTEPPRTDPSPGGGVRDGGGASGHDRERVPRRPAPEQSSPRYPAMPPPSGPARIAPGPPPRPDPLTLTTADVLVPAEIVATLPSATPQSIEDDVARDFNLVLLQRTDIALTSERLIRYRIPDGRAVGAVIAALAADARLGAPQPNLVYRNQGGRDAAVPADLQYATQKVELAAAHELARGKGAVVAVIDSGVDRHHPDLAGVISDEIDVTDGARGATYASDPHGTAVAGLIAARGLVKGVAPLARVLSIKAFRPAASGNASVSTTAMLVAGIDKAVATGAQVLNMSFAGALDPLVHRLIKAAHTKGVHLVAAAGNMGPGAPSAYPAAYPEVVAVTATDISDKLYAKANRGHYVAIAAPGVDVLAPGAARSHQLQSGTSFAAAHVSGVLALMIERRPGLSPAAARAALVSAAVDLGLPGPDEEFGAGRISAAAALRRIGGPP